MRKTLYSTLFLAQLVAATAHGQAAIFNAATPTSLPFAVGGTFFGAGLVSVLGSVDYTGPAAQLTGTTVINGDLRLRATSPLQVAAGATLYVYGNLFAPAGSLAVAVGAHVYFYGAQWLGGASAPVTGAGTLHFISPRPAAGATADNQARPAASDGLGGGGGTQLVDGSGATWTVTLEHRSATGLTLTDLDGDGSGALALSGTLALAADNALLTLGDNNLLFDQRPSGATGTVTGYSPLRYAATTGQGTVQVLGLPTGSSFTFPVGAQPSGDYTPARVTNRATGSASLALRATNSASAAPSNGIARYWQLSSPGSVAVDLDLQHNLATNQAGYDNSRATLASNAGGSFAPLGPPSAGTSTGSLSTSGPVANASELSLSSLTVSSAATLFTKVTAVPLPVSLVDFIAGRAVDGPVILRWITASELNNAGFQVQASPDGQRWVDHGSFVTGAGNSASPRSYAWQEINPAATYYRLAQRDFSGTLTYSPVRFVAALATPAWGLYPNPASAGTPVQLTGADPAQPIDVYSTLGQLTAHYPAGTLELPGLAPGLYLVRQNARTLRLVVR